MSLKSKQILVPKFPNFKKEIILFKDIEDLTPVSIILPDPPNKRQIINYNRATSNQKWERVQLPKSFDRFKGMPKESIYNRLTKEDHEFIQAEYKKLDDGFWFFNNGDLTWLSDTHYFFLNWWKIDIGHPKYKEAQAKMFWHWWKIENDPNCFGMIEMTKRRDGKSFRAGCIAYKRTAFESNHYCGIQSKTEPDAMKFFQKAVAGPWKKLPFFFQPSFDNSNNPRSELRFFTPTRRGKESQMSIATEDSLESWIEARSSVTTAFDGEKLHTSISDEEGKTVEVNVSERWDIKKPCLEVDGEIIGKQLSTTTVEEMEKYGGKYFKEQWEGSDPAKTDELGRTESGLHRHFTPAYDGYKVDEYGRSLIKESIAELNAKREGLKNNPAKLTAFKRKFPFTIREAFRSSGKECHFNIEIIDSRLEDFLFENKNLTYGDFEWKDGVVDSEVVFVPKDKERGKFVVSYLFENPKLANQKVRSGGLVIPNNVTSFIAGGDPFKFKVTTGNVKSKGSGAVFRKHDPVIDPEDKDTLSWKTHRFVCTYNNRPPSQNEYGEDMIKMCHYYGCQMFPEINVPFLWDYFTDRGYAGYLFYQKKANHRMSLTPGANTNEGTTEGMFAEFEEYIEKHGRREVHQEILEVGREVEIENLSPYDLFVSCGYALLGARKSFRVKAPVASTQHKLFHTYKVSMT